MSNPMFDSKCENDVVSTKEYVYYNIEAATERQENDSFECSDQNYEGWNLKELLRFLKEELYNQVISLIFGKKGFHFATSDCLEKKRYSNCSDG